MAAAAHHVLTLRTHISSRTQLGKSPNSKIFLGSRGQALWKRNWVFLSVRAMGSSASSQKPDNVQGCHFAVFLGVPVPKNLIFLHCRPEIIFSDSNSLLILRLADFLK